MPATQTEQPVQTFEFTRDQTIDAPIEIVFESVLDELGPESQMMDGTPMSLKLEPWPGGRWFRDLGHNAGHFWGHVQVIKPPTLLEICGPMFMSFAAVNHVQYRLATEGAGTRLTLTHKAIGLIPPEQFERMDMGWTHKLKRVRDLAQRAKESKNSKNR